MERISFLYFFQFLIACTSVPLQVGSKHLQDLRSEFPYGLLTDDYGILTREDLAIDTCQATPMQFSEKSTAYPYWQCFEVESSNLSCEGNGYDEDEKTRLTAMIVSGVRDGEPQKYISTRAISLFSCREFLKEWRRLVKGEKHVCVSGSFTQRSKNNTGKWGSLWTFERFKTHKGCESYFEGGCSLQYQLQHGCEMQSTKK